MYINFIKFFFKNLYFIYYKKRKCSIILNYHRIGNIDPKNPFHQLHTVSLNIFKLQVRICSMIGKIVSLDDLRNSNLVTRINFSITFDDVPYSSLNALEWLNNKKIPFAICPCQQITDEGIGWRDKVYFIEKFVDKKNIINHIDQAYGYIEYNKNDTFYKLSKNSIFDQSIMIAEIVNPLFESISDKFKAFKGEKNYFDINDLIFLKKSFPKMEIVNHSATHVNLTSLNINQLTKEIEICDKFLDHKLDQKSKYFAVPFGEFNASLCVGLCEAARKNKKQAIFWVANHINLDLEKKPNKVSQFCRFHTSTSILGFFKQILTALCRPGFIDHITTKISSESSEHSILLNPNLEKILAFEDVSRPTKDYSGSESYFVNFYKNNPFLEKSSHTIAEIQNERIMSIGQNLILPFKGLDKKRLINFFGNWRSISGSSKIGAAVILGKAIKEADILASYKPSKQIESSFIKMGWKPIHLKTFVYTLKNISSINKNSNFSVTHEMSKSYKFDKFKPNNINSIQIELSRELINWRVQNYELAKPVYFVLNNSESEKALVIAQFNDKKILFLDQQFSSSAALLNISKEIALWSKEKGLSEIIAESSCEQTQDIFKKCFPQAKIEDSLCYLNIKKYDKKLGNKEFIITPISSDVFLRS